MQEAEEEEREIKILKSDLCKIRTLIDNLKDQTQNDNGNELAEQQQKAKELKIKLNELKEQHIAAKKMFCEVQNKHNEVEQEYNVEDIAQNLKDFEALLSFKNCRYEPVENDENSIMITLEYNEYCYVKLIRNEFWLYSIHQIFPEHPNLTQLSQFLQETQDIKGFLSNLRKYFKFVMRYKDKIDNKDNIK